MKRITTLFIIVISCITSIETKAQIGVGTTDPSANAILDITSSDKGVLAPRVNLVSPSSNTPVNQEEGLIVFNKTEVDSLPVGLCVSIGGKWTPVSESASTGAKSEIRSAEYNGAIIFGDGTDNTGCLDATVDGTTNVYTWTSSEATAQDYFVNVKIRIPEDRNQELTNIKVAFKTDANATAGGVLTTTAGGTITVANAASATPTAFDTLTFVPTTPADVEANELVNLKLILESRSDDKASIGDIILNYK